MRNRIVPLFLLWLALALTTAARAHAADQHDCGESMAPTIESLHHCVQHAIATGHVDDAGVGRSLLVKLDAAEHAADRGQPGIAVRLLEAFIREVEAQAGLHVDVEHAAHIVVHAETVIAALAP